MVIPAKWKTLAAAVAIVAAGAPLFAACNAVLGIEEATVDPDLGLGGASGDGGTASSSGNGGGGGGQSDELTCLNYCDVIDANCREINAEYISQEVCVAMCNTFDKGQPGDSTGDSLACRLHYALKAADDPVAHCQAGGPLAQGKCADPCDSFCLLTANLCDPHPFGDPATCKTDCEAFTYLIAGDDGEVGDLLFLNGDTLNCRIYHLESAYDPAVPTASTVHCPHTKTMSAACTD
jgi:hypothetical protein